MCKTHVQWTQVSFNHVVTSESQPAFQALFTGEFSQTLEGELAPKLLKFFPQREEGILPNSPYEVYLDNKAR